MRRILVLTCLSVLWGSALLWAGSPQDTHPFETALAAGDAARANGQWVAAIQHYRAALMLQPHQADARFYLALAYRETSRFYEARRNFRLALLEKPHDRAWESQCRLQVAACWEATRNYREALLEYRLALGADADSDLARAGEKRTVAQVHGALDDSK
jgi:tetratricopeptide (TPR) repeat protein